MGMLKKMEASGFRTVCFSNFSERTVRKLPLLTDVVEGRYRTLCFERILR